jgi:hypothetical protein
MGWNIGGGGNGTSLPSELNNGWGNWNKWHDAYNRMAKAQLDDLWKKYKGRTDIDEAMDQLSQRLSKLAEKMCGQ